MTEGFLHYDFIKFIYFSKEDKHFFSSKNGGRCLLLQPILTSTLYLLDI